MAISTYLSIITLNVNGLNALIKRYRVSGRIFKEQNKKQKHTQKTRAIYMLPTRTSPQI